jgi:hypothetical protein
MLHRGIQACGRWAKAARRRAARHDKVVSEPSQSTKLEQSTKGLDTRSAVVVLVGIAVGILVGLKTGVGAGLVAGIAAAAAINGLIR